MSFQKSDESWTEPKQLGNHALLLLLVHCFNHLGSHLNTLFDIVTWTSLLDWIISTHTASFKPRKCQTGALGENQARPPDDYPNSRRGFSGCLVAHSRISRSRRPRRGRPLRPRREALRAVPRRLHGHAKSASQENVSPGSVRQDSHLTDYPGEVS